MLRSRWLQLYRLIYSTRFILVVIFGVLFPPLIAHAYELKNAEVTEENGIFRIQITATIDAPAAYIRQVLTDYTHMYRLSSSIIESEVLPSKQKDEKQIRTKLLACTSVFCREVERVDAVRTLASGDLQAVIVPELSEFRSGQAVWRIRSMNEKSKLVYEATLEPDFFIPPVVGVPAIRNSLKDEFIATFERIEKIASINLERDWSNEHTLASVAIDTRKPPCNKKLKAGLQ